MYGGDGMLGMGQLEGGGGHFGQAQMAHFACFDHATHFAHAFCDGDVFVVAVQVIQIDDIGLQAL